MKALKRTKARLKRRRALHDIAVKNDGRQMGRGLVKPGSQNRKKTSPSGRIRKVR